jgi:uncharacterized protein
MLSYVRFIVRYRFAVLGVLLLVTLAAGTVVSGVRLSGSLVDLFLGDSPKYERYKERVRTFGSDALIIVAFEEDRLFSKASIERLQAVVGDIQGLKLIKSARSVLDLEEVQVVGGFPVAEKYTDAALREPDRAAEILGRLHANPMARGLFISRDGRHSMVVCEVRHGKDHNDQNLPPLIDEILAIFETHGFDGARLHQAGQIPILVEMMTQAQFNLMRLFPVVCLVLFVTVYILFQRAWPVLITLVVTLIGVIWTTSVAVLLFGQINVMTAMTPGIIFIIAFSDVVHLCSSYHMEISKGERKEDAIEKSCSEVGSACLYTSITTFFGFVSIAVAPAPVTRQMGVVLGVGVGLALFIAMTLTPIIFTLMKAPQPMRVGAASKAQFMLNQVIDFVVNLTRRRPWAIVAGFAVLFVVTFMGVMRIEFETDITKRLAEDNHIRADAKNFAGTEFADIFIEVAEPGGLIDAGLIEGLIDYRNTLLEIPEVDKVASVLDVFEYLHGLFHSGSGGGKPPPMRNEDLSNYMFMMEMSGGDDLGRMMDAEKKVLRLRLHLNNSGMFAAKRVCETAVAAGQDRLVDAATIEASGVITLLGEWVAGFVEGQKRGLIFAFLTILMMMSISLRSLTCGLWSMLPNTIPLFMLGGYVGWFWDTVDSDTLLVAVIAIGISVDDTIHFLFRYRFERERTDDVAAALDRTFHFSGRAIIITSAILVVGFLPYGMSDFFTVRIMGTLLPLSLAGALLTDLLLVPAMIKLGAFRFKGKRRL